MRIFHLTKNVKENKIRYYTVSINKNLFGNFLVERYYGSTKNKSHTGYVKNEHKNFDDAIAFASKLKSLKIKRGYQE